MNFQLSQFFIRWGATSLALWVTSYVFSGIEFQTLSSLVVAAFLLGLANALVKPVLVILTLPLTVLTLGLFLLVINAIILLLISALVHGFHVGGFWTAFFASIFISMVSLVIEGLLVQSNKPL
jgi:putative membrane protein